MDQKLNDQDSDWGQIEDSVKKVLEPCAVSNKDRGSDYYVDNSFFVNQYSNNLRSSQRVATDQSKDRFVIDCNNIL